MKTKSDEEKYCTVSLLCEILGQKQKRSHRYREQIGGGQRWGMQGGRRERRGSKVQTSRHKIRVVGGNGQHGAYS